MSGNNTTPMIGPDGSVADVPQFGVQRAMQRGAKVGYDMIGPDGSRATVPFESVPAALKAKAQISPSSAAAFAAASVPNPRQQLMQQYDQEHSPTAGLPGSSPNPVAATPGYTAAVGLPIAAAATAMVPAVAPGLVAGAKQAVKSVPTIAAMEGISWLRHNAPLGKYIPPGAEWLPMFMGGKGEAEPTEKPPKDAGDPFRNVPDTSKDVFNVKEPAPQPRAIPPAETPAPYRYGPGQIAPENVAPPQPQAPNFVLRRTRGYLPPGPEPTPAPVRSPNLDVPYTPSGESAARQILTGFDNQQLIKIAKSRGISVTAESQLKPTVANNRIINKIVDDLKPEELDEIRSRWMESTRHQLPQGIGPEAYRTAAQQTYFPDLKVSKAKLGRMQKALESRNVEGGR